MRSVVVSSVVIKCTLFVTLSFFYNGHLLADKTLIHADKIINNLDSSKTFVRPWIEGEIAGQPGRLGIGRGVPGTCRLFGMDDYLKDYVVWSTDLMETVKVSDDGSISEASTGYFIESLSCISGPNQQPKITSENTIINADGSITVSMPVIHHGPGQFPILSGHSGACYLLGYRTAVGSSLEWSGQRSAGVSLAIDGKIYSKSTGTYMTALACKDDLKNSQSASDY